MTPSITTFSIMTHSIMALSIKGLKATFSIMTLCIIWHYSGILWHTLAYSGIMLNVIVLSVAIYCYAE
jgi:hypothetical protein